MGRDGKHVGVLSEIGWKGASIVQTEQRMPYIHVGNTSAADEDDNRPTRICRGPSQLERGRRGRHGLARVSLERRK